MYLIGFFASPFPYIILAAAYLSGFVVYYVKGSPADEADAGFLQEHARVASTISSSENDTSSLILFSDIVTDVIDSLPSQCPLQAYAGQPVLFESPPVPACYDNKLFSALYIRPPPQF